MQYPSDNKNQGLVLLTTLLLLVLLTAFSVASVSIGGMAFARSDNHRQAMAARLAAESGMAFGMALLSDFQTSPTKKAMTDILEPIRVHLTSKLTGNAVAIEKANPSKPGDIDKVIVYPRNLPDSLQFRVEITVAKWKDIGADIVPDQVKLCSIGVNGQITRTCQMNLRVVPNNPLEYGVVSSLRTIVRGNTIIEGPIMSTWGRQLSKDIRNKSTYPLDIKLKEDGRIDGYLGTVLSMEDFIGDEDLGDTDFHEGLRHEDSTIDMESKIEYDTPEIDTLPKDMFDTSDYKDMTSTANLPSPDETDIDIGVYNIKGSKWEGYDGSTAERPAMENIYLPKGTNARFKNCTFKGIVYIEVDEKTNNPSAANQNSVIFENCTFEGPVITGVPKKMDWQYNCMQFVGDTVFKKEAIAATQKGVTLLAPNYNVNIGGSEGGGGTGDSELVGMVVGGCVDLYNDLTIRGTVVSMAEVLDKNGNLNVSPGGTDEWVASDGVCGANVSNLNGTGKSHIIPDPENVVPLGVKRRYGLVSVPDTYVE